MRSLGLAAFGRVGRWILPASVAGILLALAGCGGNSAPPYNQTPTIIQIVPSNITAGSQDFTVFISGTGFISSSKGVSFAYWNGAARSTNYNVTTGQLEMTVLASDVANPGQGQITVINPAPGGGEARAAASFQVIQPQMNGAIISSITPANATVNSTPPMLTISGSNFSSSDVVSWDGQTRQSTSSYDSASQTMTLQLSKTDVASAGNASVAVGDSGLVNMSPSVIFAITGPNTPSPSVSSLQPSSASAGSADLQVLVKGSGFAPDSTVLWNALPVATAYISKSEVMALVPAADLAVSGSADVSVTTPAPGGGTSSTTSFKIQ